MKKLRILWVLIVLFHYGTVCLGCTEEERNGLMKLKPLFATYWYRDPLSTDPLSSWVDNQTSDCCGWERVRCDSITRRVIRLDLNNRGAGEIDGVLDASLYIPFEQLQHLDLSGNEFTTLQTDQDLGRLQKLQVLNISRNLFFSTSTLQSLYSLPSLTTLDLSSNDIGGSLSNLTEAFGGFRKLEVLLLRENYLSNINILQSFSGLTSLTVLDLSYNDLSGSLSDYGTGLCILRNLQELYLGYNLFSGSIPACLNNLPSLRVIDVSGNQLVGNP